MSAVPPRYILKLSCPDQAGIVHAVKYYPAGATTNSDSGVTNVERVYPVLERMERVGLPFLVHGEEELVLGAEMRVDGPLREPGGGHSRFRFRAEAAVREGADAGRVRRRRSGNAAGGQQEDRRADCRIATRRGRRGFPGGWPIAPVEPSDAARPRPAFGGEVTSAPIVRR